MEGLCGCSENNSLSLPIVEQETPFSLLSFDAKQFFSHQQQQEAVSLWSRIKACIAQLDHWVALQAKQGESC